MKKLLLIAVCLCGLAFAQGGSISTAFEPAVVPIQSHFSFGVAIAGALNLTPNNWASAQYGYSESITPTHTALLGVGRNLVEFLPGATLIGTLQAGRTFIRLGDRSLLVYGTGAATSLGDGYTVTYGVHINKQQSARLYPSVFVSLSKSF
jgi:hypothetical protein